MTSLSALGLDDGSASGSASGSSEDVSMTSRGKNIVIISIHKFTACCTLAFVLHVCLHAACVLACYILACMMIIIQDSIYTLSCVIMKQYYIV